MPVAPACVVSGKVARRCPACDRTFVMQPAFEGKVIRCRGCKSPFRVLAVQERADASSSAADSDGEHPTVFDDIGDILGQLAPGEIVASVVRPPDFGPRKRVVTSTPSPQWLNPFRRPFG